MTKNSRNLIILAVIGAGLLPAAGAQAQWYSSVSRQPPPPLYPYEVQPNRPYAVEVAPGTYVINRPAASRTRPAVRGRRAAAKPARVRSHVKADPALIEKLRKRGKTSTNGNTTVVNTTRIVRDPPTVIEHKRYVDDPPRVIERYHIVEDAPDGSRKRTAVLEDVDTGSRKNRNQSAATRTKRSRTAATIPEDGKKRVIQADAEITILGPDRMSIRLFRKSGGTRANASLE